MGTALYRVVRKVSPSMEYTIIMENILSMELSCEFGSEGWEFGGWGSCPVIVREVQDQRKHRP